MAFRQVTGGSWWPREDQGGGRGTAQLATSIKRSVQSRSRSRSWTLCGCAAQVRHTRHAAGCRCCSVASAQLQLGLELGNSAVCNGDGDGNDSSPATRRWLIQSGRSARAQSIKNIRIEHVRWARATNEGSTRRRRRFIHSYPYPHTYICIYIHLPCW